jgi:hypothetical protein
MIAIPLAVVLAATAPGSAASTSHFATRRPHRSVRLGQIALSTPNSSKSQRRQASLARAHFLIIFMPLTPGGGRRCAPAAVTTLVRPTLTGTSTARAALPTHLGKLHEPVNPCPRATFSVTRVTAGV